MLSTLVARMRGADSCTITRIENATIETFHKYRLRPVSRRRSANAPYGDGIPLYCRGIVSTCTVPVVVPLAVMRWQTRDLQVRDRAWIFGPLDRCEMAINQAERQSE